MARIIRTHETDLDSLEPFTRDQVYNGLDVCVTHDVFSAIHPQLDDDTSRTYTLSRALQGPTIEMRIRGVLVDQARQHEVMDEIAGIIDRLERQLLQIVQQGIGFLDFNWRSHAHLQRLFYTELGIKPIIKQGRPTTDRGAREKLAAYPIAAQIIAHINTLTELGDKLSVLKTSLDRDGRIRTSYNIAGTSTGRFSSSLSEFGTGGNLQNVEESIRPIFIADPGYKFAKCDAKSGESFCVGAIEWNRFRDGRYLDACESGDPHTAAARIVWPELAWTGDIKRDKHLAETPFYRHYTYRFMCKKLGHGSNYGGKPFTLAEQTKLDIGIVEEFQYKYFKAFPAHQQWQSDVDTRLRQLGYLISLLGRKRWFFGRRSDPSTLREAIAYDPQSSLRDIVSAAMIRIWRSRIAIIAMDDHDALTFMYREQDEADVIPKLLSALVVEVPLEGGRVLRIPYDCEVGWNKGHYDPVHNPDGLRAYPGPGRDNRVRSPQRSVVDVIMSQAPVKAIR